MFEGQKALEGLNLSDGPFTLGRGGGHKQHVYTRLGFIIIKAYILF